MRWPQSGLTHIMTLNYFFSLRNRIPLFHISPGLIPEFLVVRVSGFNLIPAELLVLSAGIFTAANPSYHADSGIPLAWYFAPILFTTFVHPMLRIRD